MLIFPKGEKTFDSQISSCCSKSGHVS